MITIFFVRQKETHLKMKFIAKKYNLENLRDIFRPDRENGMKWIYGEYLITNLFVAGNSQFPNVSLILRDYDLPD